MASSILSVGQSALAAAQIGLITTGHNIANANTPGYSRQVVVQASAGSQNTGVGYVGKGTEVADVKRVFDEFLNNQVVSAQTSKGELDSYYAQIRQINNQFADSNAGLAPVLQDFFKGLQTLASNANDGAARETALSNANTLAARFNSLDGQLKEAAQSVNGQIKSSIDTINVYAKQLASLNDAIEKAQGIGDGKVPNDLLDQRDYMVSELSKEIKTTVVKQGPSYSVYIGNGQPLVIGKKTYDLAPTISATDANRTSVGYSNNGNVVALDERSLTGGKLGGLLAFRSNTLDSVQNSLGQIALGLAQTFNAQHALGQDLNNAMGGDFFSIGEPRVDGNRANSGTVKVTAAVADFSALKFSDYRLEYDGTDYKVTRLSDNTQVYSGGAFPAGPVDGITFDTDATPDGFAAGNEYIIRPFVDAAKQFGVAITDPSKIAAAAPIKTVADTTNTGSGQISAGTVDAPMTVTAGTLRTPLTIKFTSTSPLTYDVDTVPPSVPPATPLQVGVAYKPGDNISINGWTVQITGNPAAGDSFTVGPNDGGVRDNRNALLLTGLQTKGTLSGATYQSAYAQLVSRVGNKTRELEVTSQAQGKMLDGAIAAQQAVSGVNLDEEATNLLRYQQAYQAAGKVMQTTSQLFDLLLNLGNR